MGQNKAALPVGQRTLVERVVGAVQGLGIPYFFIAADPSSYARFDRPVHSDIHPGNGPLGGLHTALTKAQSDAVLLLACDLPFLTTPFLDFLLGALGSFPAVVPASADGRLHPLSAVYRRSCLPAAETALAEQRLGMTALCRQLGARTLPAEKWAAYDAQGMLLANVNTPTELARARQASTGL